MFKNVASQKFRVFAFDSATGLPKSGDAANITAYISKDYGAVTVLADTSATEEDATNAKGYYLFDAAQAETNADVINVTAKSSTSNIVVVGAPAPITTLPTTGILAPATAGRTLVVDASGLADACAVKVGPTGAGTAQTARDLGASVLLSSGTGTGQLDFTLGVVKADVTQYGGSAGTFASGRPEVNATHIAGSAVSTSSAQLGVNVVNAGGTAWASGSLTSGVFAAGAITAAAIAPDAIGASELAADAVAEIRAAVTGGAYALDTDANGRMRVVDGTAAGEIDTTLGAIAHVVLCDTATTLTNAPADTSGTTTLLSRLSSARAGYLDNLSAGAVATAAAIAALNNVSAAQVLAQVEAALATDTYAEPSQGAPAATASLAAKIGWLYTSWRNKKDNDGTTTNLYADNGTTVLAKQATASSAGTVSKAEWITGA